MGWVAGAGARAADPGPKKKNADAIPHLSKHILKEWTARLHPCTPAAESQVLSPVSVPEWLLAPVKVPTDGRIWPLPF